MNQGGEHIVQPDAVDFSEEKGGGIGKEEKNHSGAGRKETARTGRTGQQEQKIKAQSEKERKQQMRQNGCRFQLTEDFRKQEAGFLIRNGGKDSAEDSAQIPDGEECARDGGKRDETGDKQFSDFLHENPHFHGCLQDISVIYYKGDETQNQEKIMNLCEKMFENLYFLWKIGSFLDCFCGNMV